VPPKDDMPNPGRKYASTTKTAFFPMSTEGVQLVDKLQDAFSARLLFTVKSAADASGDELVWNGVCHKTNVFGGPQQYVDSLWTAFVMVALCNRADHYIFVLLLSFFLLSSSSFFPRLISAVGDWMFTILWHMVWP